MDPVGIAELKLSDVQIKRIIESGFKPEQKVLFSKVLYYFDIILKN